MLPSSRNSDNPSIKLYELNLHSQVAMTESDSFDSPVYHEAPPFGLSSQTAQLCNDHGLPDRYSEKIFRVNEEDECMKEALKTLKSLLWYYSFNPCENTRLGFYILPPKTS